MLVGAGALGNQVDLAERILGRLLDLAELGFRGLDIEQGLRHLHAIGIAGGLHLLRGLGESLLGTQHLRGRSVADGLVVLLLELAVFLGALLLVLGDGLLQLVGLGGGVLLGLLDLGVDRLHLAIHAHALRGGGGVRQQAVALGGQSLELRCQQRIDVGLLGREIRLVGNRVRLALGIELALGIGEGLLRGLPRTLVGRHVVGELGTVDAQAASAATAIALGVQPRLFGVLGGGGGEQLLFGVVRSALETALLDLVFDARQLGLLPHQRGLLFELFRLVFRLRSGLDAGIRSHLLKHLELSGKRLSHAGHHQTVLFRLCFR